jgi:site-specific DNA-methyltransferase (adenine-specific)
MSELVYAADGVSIWQGDARALPLADDSVHLIVTSPPYNARIAYDGYSDWLPWDRYWRELITPTLYECYRVLVDGGRIALNMPNVLRQNVGEGARFVEYRARGGRKWKPAGSNGTVWSVVVDEHLWPLLRTVGFEPRERLTWIKAGEPDDAVVSNSSTAWGSWRSASNPVLRAIAEPVFVASKGSFQREPGRSDLTRDEFLVLTRNTWFITTGHIDQNIGHPAMFPLELPRRLIKLYSYIGDTVLDPFMGSGTTLRAAKNVGRLAVGVEQSERYCRLAAARCAQSVMRLEDTA